jgi:hypothetical protein
MVPNCKYRNDLWLGTMHWLVGQLQAVLGILKLDKSLNTYLHHQLAVHFI